MADGRRRGGWLTNTFKAMNDWGDEFEKKHFDGDLKGTLSKAPKKAAEAMNEWGDDFERRHFDGDVVGVVTQATQKAADVVTSTLEVLDDSFVGIAPYSDDFDFVGAGSISAAGGYAEDNWANEGADFAEGGGSSSSAASASGTARQSQAEAGSSWTRVQLLQEERRKQMDANNGATPQLWQVAQRLKEQLEEERCKRRGRIAAMDALDPSTCILRAEVAEERHKAAIAEEQRSVAGARSYTAERGLAQLQECHHAQLSRKAANEAEMQQHALAAAAASAAASEDAQLREYEGPRAWARAGPEMEALKAAKLECAEVLGLLDEARLHRRRELRALQEEIEALEAKNKTLKLAADGYVAPGNSFRQSIKRLFRVAAGKEDIDP